MILLGSGTSVANNVTEQDTQKLAPKLTNINNEIHYGIKMNIAKKNSEFKDGATALMDLRNSTEDGNDDDNNKKASSNNNDNALQTSNEVDNTSENNMINDNDATNEVDNTSETNINDDNDATKERSNLKLPFAEMYAPKINNIAPEFHNGIVMKMGKKVASKNNMSHEDYGILRTYAPKLTKIHTSFQEGVAMKQTKKVSSANNTEDEDDNSKHFLENKRKIGKNARKRGGKTLKDMPLPPKDIIREECNSDDYLSGFSNYDSDGDGMKSYDTNDTDDLISVDYPPPFLHGWNGQLHMCLGQKEHHYNTVITVTKIDKGSFVDTKNEVEKGHILMKINDDWVHEYPYEAVMAEIYDQMKQIKSYPGEYFLTLKFSREKVYFIDGKRARKPDGFYARDYSDDGNVIEISNNDNDDGAELLKK